MSTPAAGQPASAPVLSPPSGVDGQVLARMRTLAAHPPQSLVMEGGTVQDREAAALAWASLLNCPERGCGSCTVCHQINGRIYRDLLVVDKVFFEEAKKEGKSGTDKVRELLPVWGQPPHGAGSRVTVFPEAHELHLSVSNLLLKTLEEPRPGNVFVLLAPQRERLLQTLVSRSFVLTLPWPEAKAPEADAQEWIAALLHFWDTGQGWFERTGTKGAADRSLAQRVLSGLQSALILAHSGQESPVARRLAQRLGPDGLRRLDLVLGTAQEALSQPTAPVALVLDWLATAVIAKKTQPTPRRG